MSEPERQPIEPIEATPDKPITDKYVVVQSYSLNDLKRPDSEVCIRYTIATIVQL